MSLAGSAAGNSGGMVGVSVTFRMGLDGRGCAAALNKAVRPGYR